jgi:DNA-binding Xre family transcriptional regulator
MFLRHRGVFIKHSDVFLKHGDGDWDRVFLCWGQCCLLRGKIGVALKHLWGWLGNLERCLKVLFYNLYKSPVYMLQLNLRPIFMARGIEKPYAFLRKHGFNHYTATGIMTNKRPAVLLSHIERLCELLLCEPNDLFLWQPSRPGTVTDGHPLQALLRAAPLEQPINRALAKVPYKKLPALRALLNSGINGM